MKILMLGWELPPHNSGGLGVACVNLGKALASQGADIDFVVPYTAEHPGIDFMKIVPATPYSPLYRYGWGAYDSKNIESEILPVQQQDKSNPSFISMREVQQEYCDFVQKYLMVFKPDVIHAHDWLTFEAAMLAKKNYGIPVVAHVHATEFDRSGMNGGNQLVHEIEYQGLVAADKILAVSGATRELIHARYAIPLDKIDVAYNALDEAFLRQDYYYNRSNFPYLEHLKERGYTIVSTVGRFTIQKGLWHLMHAAALALRRDPKLMFIFAGDGEERNELLKTAADFGIAEHVIFTGFIRGKALRDVYAVSDIFIMSSVSEPFGLTALEAAHHGCALVLTKQSGVAEVLPSALTYDFWDDEKLSKSIVDISLNPEYKHRLQEAVTAEYRRISWSDVAERCLHAYEAVERPRAGRGKSPRRAK